MRTLTIYLAVGAGSVTVLICLCAWMPGPVGDVACGFVEPVVRLSQMGW